VFDALPKRPPRRITNHESSSSGSGGPTNGAEDRGVGQPDGAEGDPENKERVEEGLDRRKSKEEIVVQHQDAKRVLLAMKAHDGYCGDGTVAYYIVQEGEVKPRQN
jgi:hypothetical protein